VLRSQVLTRDGKALSGVPVKGSGHPAVGQTATRANGPSLVPRPTRQYDLS
jgi:hypothetical protein